MVNITKDSAILKQHTIREINLVDSFLLLQDLVVSQSKLHGMGPPFCRWRDSSMNVYDKVIMLSRAEEVRELNTYIHYVLYSCYIVDHYRPLSLI